MASKTATKEHVAAPATDGDMMSSFQDESARANHNMRIWNRVCETDPSMQKEVTLGRKWTAVDPHWQVQEATKLWGPYGDRWGLYSLIFDRFEVDGVDKTGAEYRQVILSLIAEFCYPVEEPGDPGVYRTAAFPVANDMEFKRGQDIYKKLVTNTRSKAMSLLGFSADVYLGMFEDQDYIKDLKAKYKDKEQLVKEVLGTVRPATSQETLDKVRFRLKEMAAGKTISGNMAADLLGEVSAREQELARGE